MQPCGINHELYRGMKDAAMRKMKISTLTACVSKWSQKGSLGWIIRNLHTTPLLLLWKLPFNINSFLLLEKKNWCSKHEKNHFLKARCQRNMSLNDLKTSSKRLCIRSIFLLRGLICPSAPDWQLQPRQHRHRQRSETTCSQLAELVQWYQRTHLAWQGTGRMGMAACSRASGWWQMTHSWCRGPRGHVENGEWKGRSGHCSSRECVFSGQEH